MTFFAGYDAWKTAYPPEWDDESKETSCDVHGFVKADGRVYEISISDFTPYWTYSGGNEVDDLASLGVEISYLGFLREPISYQQAWDDGDVSVELCNAIEALCLETYADCDCMTEEEAKYDDRDYDDDREAA